MLEAVTMPLPADPMREMIDQVARDHRLVVLTRDGAPVAAIVPVEDLWALRELDDMEDAHWSRVAAEAIARWEAEGRPPGIPHEEIMVRYGIDPNQP